jgi:hypothetical protein
MIAKLPVLCGRKIPKFILAAYIQFVIRAKFKRPYNAFIRERIYLPIDTIKGQYSLTVGKIQDAVLILAYLPVLCPRLIILFGIIDYVGKPDSILGKAKII